VRRLGLLAVASSVLVVLAGASDPEIIRARVPAKEVSKWFPAGSELRIMPVEDFEKLVGSAVAGAAREPVAAPPRFKRAHHHARWESGVVSGRTELVIEAASKGSALFILDPWTPAILATAKTAKVLGALDSGKPAVWIDPGPARIVELEWELRPQSHARGRSFTLGLPGDETTVLALEVPKTWVPSAHRGRRRGPLPAANPDWNLWEIEAESGRIELHAYDPEANESLVRLGAWISGSTQIDLRRATYRSRGLVNWTTDWRVELDPRNPKRLEIELDPTLELIKVQGPAVRGYRIERMGAATRLEVTLDHELRSTAQLQFLANARVPLEGPWRIPAILPLDATWTGGDTTVILDEFHALAECKEEAGRRIITPPVDSGPNDRLVFESESPQSVAQLVFKKPRVESSCAVRGRLFLAGSPPRIETQLDWTFHHGAKSELEVDLSPAWVPDHVAIRGSSDSVAWHSSVLASGGTRLTVALPATTAALKELVLLVGASSAVPGGRGPLDLPRVVPIGTHTVDEVWGAWVDHETMIQPTAAQGLVWIDPGLVPGLTIPRAAGGDLREALAWRWVAEHGRARVDRERIEQEPSASIRMRAQVDPSGRRLVLDGRLTVSAGAQSLESVPVWIGARGDALKSWQFHDEADGSQVARAPIDETNRAGSGFPREGSALRLNVKVAGQSERRIYFSADTRWNSRGSIPLVAVPRNYLFRGTILVETPANLLPHITAAGMRRLDPVARDEGEFDRGLDDDGESRTELLPKNNITKHLFGYNEPSARLELFTEPFAASRPPGIIRDALLSTLVSLNGATVNRLRLLVHSGEARSLELSLGRGLSVVRVRRDGADVATSLRSGGISIPLVSQSGQGAGPSVIVVDYVASNGTIADGVGVRPDLPQVDLPCLSFVWALVAPPGWKAADAGPGWIANDRENRGDWPYAPLGLWKPPWGFMSDRGRASDAALLHYLDDKLVDPAADEMTFAEWFSRWDSGPRPIVIDRVALDAAGFGPKSLCVPSRLRADHRNVSRATLEQHGLALIPFPAALLVSSATELRSFEHPRAWEDALAEALLWGSDRTDRFQTLPHWRGEPSPKLGATGGDEAGERVKLLDGWSTSRFSQPNWPAENAFVHLIDLRSRIVTGWLITGAAFLGWILCRRRLAGSRFLVLGLFLAASLLADWLLPWRYASFTAAAFLAPLVILLFELGFGISGSIVARGTLRRLRNRLFRRAASAAVAGVLSCLSLARLVSGQPLAEPEPGAAILALFPYEGAFDPSRPPEDVILRLADFSRLASWAANEGAAPLDSVRAIAVLHRVNRTSRQNIVVESEFELMASGRGPFTWRIPVSFARDIEATLEGAPVPIRIEPGGVMGTVALARAGRHLLRIRRAAAARVDAAFETLSLPVNAVPSARVTVAPQEGAIEPAELNARGRTERGADGSVSGWLGPVARIEVRWPHREAFLAARSLGPVEGLILWDIKPAGDRLRARLTFHQPQELSTLRLAHQPGLVLRKASASDAIAIFCGENAGQDEWTVHIDPPLKAGEVIELDCWMPMGAGRSAAGQPASLPPGGAPPPRRLPDFAPIGAERYYGSLGVRRPGDWSGRFDPIPGTDPISDEAFAKMWGNLPEEALTLCGTSRFVREARASLATGPTPTRILVKPAVGLQLEPGRIAVAVDAELTELSGHLRQMEAKLPESIRVTEVTAEGLTDWTTSRDERLRLMFDQPARGPRRRLRILGWIPVAEDPLQTGLRQHRVRVPWVRWDGTEGRGGSLTISSNSKPVLQGSSDLTLIAAEPSVADGTTPPRHRLTYIVSDASKLGEIVWESVPARVSVTIESQLTIHPDSAEWIAVLRYDVVGGALEAIRFKMPVEWASRASLHLAGGEYRLTTETRGPAAYWSITPERPIWGSQRFVLRSTLPLGADRELVHPEVAPLGRGAVDAYVAVMNASGGSRTIENPFGLEPIARTTRFRAREFAVDAGTPLGAFRVAQEPWVLRVLLPVRTAETADSRGKSARVALADLVVAVMSDRSSLGRAIFETVPGSGTLLLFELPAGSTLLWATVDSNPAVPLRSPSGRFSIVVDDRRPSRVGLIWRIAPALSQPAGSSWPVALPRVGTGPATTLVRVIVPPDLAIAGDLGSLEPTTMARLELARADRLAGSIGDFVTKIDRSSGRDHERLVALLISHEMALRSAERSESQSDPRTGGAASDRVKQHSELIRAARATRVETTSRAALQQDLAAASGYLGTSSAELSRPLVGVSEPNAADRIRRFGRPFPYIGVLPGLDELPPKTSLILEPRLWQNDTTRPRARAMVGLVMVVACVVLATARRRGVWTQLAGLAVALGFAGYTGGPLALVGGLGIAAAGWRKARS
jgi:hypothetical protein